MCNNIFISSYGDGKRKEKRKYEKENDERVIKSLFHLMATVKEKREEKYAKENGKREIISLFHLTTTVKEKSK